MFSKACEYGLKATLYIAHESQKGNRVSMKAISNAIDSPLAFTAKVLQQLARTGIVDSVRGPAGGFEIDTSKQLEVKLSDIVAAIDGDKIYKGCGLGLKECNGTKPCPVHDKFEDVRNGLKSMLENTSLLELAQGLEAGVTFLK
jgi:Rrf2 family iron-sulfur cluster assembly transcriptional regulator